MVRESADATRLTPGNGLPEVVRWEPSPQLRPFVKQYIGYSEESHARRLQVPHAGVVVILNLGATLAIVDEARATEPVQVRHSFVAGLHDRAVVTHAGDDSRGIQLDFTAIGAHLFFGGLPMYEVANGAFSLDEVLGPEVVRLVDHLAALRSWEERFLLVDRFVGRRLACGRTPDEGVVWAWRRMLRSGGNAPVSELTKELGWSRKRLAQRFRHQVGLTPKTFGQVVRFSRAAQRLAERKAQLADVAYECGYYDQAHFTREFARFAGMPPGQYAAHIGAGAESLLVLNGGEAFEA